MSIATGLMVFSAIMQCVFDRNSFEGTFLFYVLSGLVLLELLDSLRSASIVEWFAYFNIKLPLLLYSFSILAFAKKLDKRFLVLGGTMYCASVTLTGVLSMIHYFLNYNALNALVLQSKPIPIMGEIHHITFSVFCGFAVILASYLAYVFKIKWLWVLAFLNFLALHILAARTGLTGFYFALAVLGILYIFKNKTNRKVLILGFSLASLLPIAAFYSVPSFHNRVINSIEDLKAIYTQDDANYQSLGMRIEASKTAINLIKKYPVFGIGNSNLRKAMEIQYEEDNTNLFLENRILPHNQFIMETTIHGIAGLLLLILFFAYPLYRGLSKLPVLFVSLWAMILFATMFECLFDRQHGVVIVGLLLFLFSVKITPSEKEDIKLTQLQA